MSMLEELKKKMDNVNVEDKALTTATYKLFEEYYIEVSKKSKRNKEQYFKIQRISTGCVAMASVFGIIATIIASFNVVADFVPFLTGIASIFSTLSTILLAKREFKKNLETWLRHQSNKAALEFEMTKYILKTAHYFRLDDEEAFQLFREKFITIAEENQQKFAFNMNKFEENNKNNKIDV